MKIYLASSWKNAEQVKQTKKLLEAKGHVVDAFCDPSSGRFVFSLDSLDNAATNTAKTVLDEPEVMRAFKEDKSWLDWSEAVVLILPAGKSAHLEAGYAKGQGKHLIIYQKEFPVGEYDVMYGFADLVTDELNAVFDYLAYEKMCLSCKHFDIPPKCKLDGEETEPTFGCDRHEPGVNKKVDNPEMLCPCGCGMDPCLES